ncbi:cylicin-1-like, partial [Schistocerca gregaria]|uniref:cylicin-1-like n=1 Tax=Schistocerca gregaria TaxID=7010 RepID=UPI00211F4439
MFSRGRRCKVEFEVKVERAEGLPSDLKGKSFYVALKRGQEYSGHSPLMVSKDSEMSVGHSFKFTSYLDWAEKAKGTFLPKELKFKVVAKRKRFLEAKVAEAKFDLSKLVSIGGARREEGKQRIRCCGKKDTCIVLVVTFNAKVLKIDGKVLKKVPRVPEEGGGTSSGDGGADVEASQVGREPQRERQFVRVNDESYCLETDLEMSEQQVRSLDDSLSESVLSLRELGEDELSESEPILRLEKGKRGESGVDEVEESSHAERDHRSEEEAKQDPPSGHENSVSGEAELGRLQGRRRSNEGAERWLEESAPQSKVGDEVAKLSLSSDTAPWGGGKEKFRGLHESDDVVQKLKQEEAKRRRLSADLRSLDSESADRYDQVCANSFGTEDLGKGENAKKKKKGALKRLGLHFLSKEKSKSLKSDHSSEKPVFDKPAREDASTHPNSTRSSRHSLKKFDESDAEKSKVDSSSMSTSEGQESRSGSYSKEDELAEKSHESSSTDKDARRSSRKLTSRPRSEKGARDSLKKGRKEEDLEEPSRDKGKPDARMRRITLDRNSLDDGELSYKTSDDIGESVS